MLEYLVILVYELIPYYCSHIVIVSTSIIFLVCSSLRPFRPSYYHTFYIIVSLVKSKIFVILYFLLVILYVLYRLSLDFMQRIKELEKKFPLQYGKNNSLLRKKSAPISSLTPETKILAEALSMLMWEHDGVGLAAPQI